MSTLHTHTRSRWQGLQPDKFIGAVLYGPLRTQIKELHTLISLYTGILHRSPTGASLRLGAPPAGGPNSIVRVRDLFKHMRACTADASDIIHGDNPTVKIAVYTHEGYILFTTHEVRRYLNNVERWARCLLNDPCANSMAIPELDGIHARDIALDILEHLVRVNNLLDFSQSYAAGLMERHQYAV